MRTYFFSALFFISSLVSAQGLPLKSGSSSSLATVNATNQLYTTDAMDGGWLGGEMLIGPTGRLTDVTEANQSNVSLTSPMWDDTLNTLAQNTAKYREPITTMTVTHLGGYAIINGGAITSINTNAAIQTYRTFPLYMKSELRVNTSMVRTVAPQANCVEEIGLFTAALPGAAAPTDGCFFRWNASAEFRGVCSYNGTETQTAALTSPSINVNHDYTIVIQTNTVLFNVDDVQVGKLTLLTDAPTEGQPMMQDAVPYTARQYIGSSAPSLADQMKISDIFVTQRGGYPNRSWQEAKAGFGHMLAQGQNGGTMGSTALLTNSLACGAGAAMTNTTAALGSGLGGQFAALPTLAVPTDGILSSYQNPVGGVNQTPRNLVITGVKIDGVVSTILAGGPVSYVYSLAYGHTAVSLATAESATAKAPRRVPLGISNFIVTAPVGTTASTGFIQFTDPIYVAPGEFVQTVAKNVGVVTTTGVICFLVSFAGHWE